MTSFNRHSEASPKRDTPVALPGTREVHRVLWAALFPILLLVGGKSAPADEDLLALLKEPGHVLIMRHALAPGTGDPEGFRVEDCTTQRNLSTQGRAQARQLGEELRRAGIDAARVYSSRWCRCLDTAKELGLGPVTPLETLDSLFRAPRPAIETRTDALRDFLGDLGPGDPVILVTHQANIRHLVDRATPSGGGLVLRAEPDGSLLVLGSVGGRSP